MPRFFTRDIYGGIAHITGPDAAHIAKSLRMKPGEGIAVCDCLGTDYICELVSVESSRVEARILSKEKSSGEPGVYIRLYQAMPKGDKLDFIVQKAVELGASEIIPVMTSRCISRPDHGSMAKKLEKLSRTALEAAKQSGRGIIPLVMPMLGYENALTEMKKADLALLFYEESHTPLKTLLEGNRVKAISVMTGSEGGFSPDEARAASEAGIFTASLGTRILRCETAPIAALAAILYGTENM